MARKIKRKNRITSFFMVLPSFILSLYSTRAKKVKKIIILANTPP
ncbi:MAG: hypothetical protein OP8BY_1235 [Candidatus Saccharicenans subterraneus]|uniref:Uncharacterized protein n=1 Tax=Candidatus Saccharicenans subterraneus TaxID=2508984 RepID=A0A3E2BPP7_9BACT|nr:MAG: hypothetical protein OP8BY_1235 [Candidatus Saccharicenans subterraneum]